MTTINAYINFNNHCREAMEFYKSCIGGELNFLTVGESPMAANCPTSMHGQIMHSSLTKGALVLMGSDMVWPDGLTVGNNIALSINCSSEEEINSFYTSLLAGGKILDELKTQFWGAMFGVVIDKFGIRWMLNYDKK